MDKKEKINTLDRRKDESISYLNELKAIEKSKKNLVKIEIQHGYAWCTPRMAETLKATQS